MAGNYSPCLHYDCSNRNSFGYCKTTVCINEHYNQEQWGLSSTTNKVENIVIKQQTNGDKIRSKNDYDLADWLAQIIDCCWNAGRCGECDEDCPMYNCCNNQLSDNIEDWLKQRVDET